MTEREAIRMSGILYWRDARAVNKARRAGLWWAEAGTAAHLYSVWPTFDTTAGWRVHPGRVPATAYRAFCDAGLWGRYGAEKYYETQIEAFEEFCRCYQKIPPWLKFYLLRGSGPGTPGA